MIFYKALKYYILDFCIENFFKVLEKNIHHHKMDIIFLESLTKGMRLKQMEVYGSKYTNCLIWDIKRETGSDGVVWYMITFSFDECTYDAENPAEVSVCVQEEVDGELKLYI
jgi:hypothetical protein